MEQLRWYSLDSDLKVVDQGVVTFEKATGVIDRYISLQSGSVTSCEEAIARSMFGFCIDDKTFIEISMDTAREYNIKLEMPDMLKLMFLKIPRLYQKEIHVAGREKLLDIVQNFFEKDLQEFKTYFNNL